MSCAARPSRQGSSRYSPGDCRILDSTVAMKSTSLLSTFQRVTRSHRLGGGGGGHLDSLNASPIPMPPARSRPRWTIADDADDGPRAHDPHIVLNGEPSVARQPKVWANITADKHQRRVLAPTKSTSNTGKGEKTYVYRPLCAGCGLQLPADGRVFMFPYLLNTIIASRAPGSCR